MHTRVASRRVTLFAVGGALVLLMAADRAGLLLAPRQNDMVSHHGGTFRIIRCITPLLIELDAPDALAASETTQIMLWGIAMPEGEGETEALAFIRAYEGQAVTLTLEAQRTRDPFGRILAHVHLAAGGTLNEALLEAGLASVEERWPHAMLTRYAQAQNHARRHRRGMWHDRP